MRPIALKESVFPLHHHAKVLVIEEQHFDGNIFAVARREFLDVHEDAPVAVDVHHERLRVSHLCAHGRRQTEAHRAKPA